MMSAKLTTGTRHAIPMNASVDTSIMTKTTQRVVLPDWWTTSKVGGVGETVGI